MALAGIGTIGFALGVWQARPAAVFADPPTGPAVPTTSQNPYKALPTGGVIGGVLTSMDGDYAKRAVAYIHGSPISREELGEYLSLGDWLVVMSSFVGRVMTEPRRFCVTSEMLDFVPAARAEVATEGVSA